MKKIITTSILLLLLLAGCGMPIECPDEYECDQLVEELRLLRKEIK